jgi:hypothetical protein
MATPRVTAPPPAAPPPAHPKTRVWWIIPLTLLVLGGVTWLLLAGLPFGGEDRPATTRPATETIAEGTSTADNRPIGTATIVDVTEDEPELVPTTTTEAPPPNVSSTPTNTAPPPRRTIPVPTEPVQAIPVQPAPTRSDPAPAPVRRPVTRDAEISESEAVGTLRSFVTSRNPYGIASNCVGIASRGYRNVGYTLEVVDTCNDSRLLGRWRVDSKTREVFRQREDGRYLRP